MRRYRRYWLYPRRTAQLESPWAEVENLRSARAAATARQLKVLQSGLRSAWLGRKKRRLSQVAFVYTLRECGNVGLYSTEPGKREGKNLGPRCRFRLQANAGRAAVVFFNGLGVSPGK